MPASYPPFPEASARCDAGDAVSCAWVASMYRYGIKVPYSADHVDRALAYATRACELGLVEGCTDLAIIYAEGGRDVAKAETHFGASCLRGHALACVHLAMLQPTRMVPERLAAQAFPIIDADCATPPRVKAPAYVWRTYDESSCEIAGRMLEAGRGVERDVKRARASFARACSSSTTACDLARSPDGEECSQQCRGTAEHSSTCVAGICEPDLPVGAACGGKTACTRGTYCALSAAAPTCAPKKMAGAPCTMSFECADEYCEAGLCSRPRVYPN